MKNKDTKSSAYHDTSSRIIPMTIMLIVLCGFSFYLGGIYFSEKNRFFKQDVAPAILHKQSVVAPLRIESVEFPECSSDYQDYTPCTDPKVFLISACQCLALDVIQSQTSWYMTIENMNGDCFRFSLFLGYTLVQCIFLQYLACSFCSLVDPGDMVAFSAYWYLTFQVLSP